MTEAIERLRGDLIAALREGLAELDPALLVERALPPDVLLLCAAS